MIDESDWLKLQIRQNTELAEQRNLFKAMEVKLNRDRRMGKMSREVDMTQK